jgi:hypothetical protein
MDVDVTEDDLAQRVSQDLDEWEKLNGEWVEEAHLCYSMLHGDQWSDEDAEAMREQKRPIVSMNRIAAMIRGVCGLEVSQRQEVRYLAPEQGDVATTEMQNAIAKWARNRCDAEDEESEAFRDQVTAGMGWTETRVDFDEDPQGKIVIERVDPLDMRWDPLAQKKGLADSRWRARLKKMTLEDVKAQWPDKEDEIVANTAADEIKLVTHKNLPSEAYRSEGDTNISTKDEVIVTQYQYWRHRHFAKVMTPMGNVVDMPADRAHMLAEKGAPLTVMSRFRKREYRQAVTCGNVVLEDLPLQTSGFTLIPITGIRDRNRGYWYGLVRDMVDPQRWANKFFTSFIDIVATNAKGGVMAESTAVEDPRRFEEDWANPRATVWLKAGGLQKIQQREAPPVPAAISQMMEFAVNSLPHVSGINLEFLGTTNRDQPGILEYHRKQSVSNSLAEFFASMKLYRKAQGRVMLELIHTYLADGRMIRVLGKEGEQVIPLMRQVDLNFDVLVDEAPTSPDRKMQTWLALQELLPLALKAGLPVPPEVLDYSPLPVALAQDWKKMLQETPAISPQVQQQMEEMQKQAEQLQAENAQLKDKKAETQAELQLETFKTQAEAQARQQQAQFDMALEQQRAQHDARMAEMEFQREQEREERKLALEEWKIQREIELEEFKASQQAKLAEKKTMLDAANAEQQTELQANRTKLKFEKKGGKVQTVTDGNGKRYVVERGADGKLVGLRPDTTIQ